VYDLFPILQERAGMAAASLSGGEQQMLAIGRALMSRPRVLLLDEPSMGLAPMVVQQILDVLRRIKLTGMTMILIEQNPDFAFGLADRCCVMESGHIVLEGPTDILRNHEQMASLYLGSA
jgi:branched-chain amino acid transport system ATP-binding protein